MMSREAREARLKENLQRRASEFGLDGPKYWEDKELWLTWFEHWWESWVLQCSERISDSEFDILSRSVWVIPKSIYDIGIGLVGNEWKNPNLDFEWDEDGFTDAIDLDFPLVGVLASSKAILYETSARMDGGLGVIRGILRHQQEFGEAEINSLKQDLYENLATGKSSFPHSSHHIAWLRENQRDDEAKKHMERHCRIIDAFIDQMLEDGVICEDDGMYFVSVD